jgi:hypothetical protein
VVGIAIIFAHMSLGEKEYASPIEFRRKFTLRPDTEKK